MTMPSMDWGFASAAHEGEKVSGDRCLVRLHDAGALIAIVDGLGHGPEAARAAAIATDILARFADRPIEELIRLCHQGLAGTRGAVLLVAAYDAADGTLTWEGVGNTLGVLARADPSMRPGLEVLLPREGVLGVSLPQVSATSVVVRAGDLLVLVTDGIRDDFVRTAKPGAEPQRTAERILALHNKGVDDALALVVRLGTPAP